MRNFLTVTQIVVSLFLIIAILLQPKGEGLSQTIGSVSDFYKTKRGVEKVLFIITILLIVIFLILSLLNFLIR